MANPVHVKLVRAGRDAVTQWRDRAQAIGAIDREHDGMPRLDLSGADLAGADLHEIEFWDANLRGADMARAMLHYAQLIGADLRDADLSGANLTWANMPLTKLSGAIVGLTAFGETNLFRAQGLDQVRHIGPSYLDHGTLERSGMLDEAFMLGCGLPDHLVQDYRAFHTNPIQFYSCFISYSSKDDAFTAKLHRDLTAEGIKAWRAPDDLKIGDKLRPRIDEAILLHDKLLLVLSENSISSAWVESEVEAALEKERRNPEHTVLFPVRLDESVMETSVAWASEIRRTRHIGDFGTWTNEPEYARALQRLIKDLKQDLTKKTT